MKTQNRVTKSLALIALALVVAVAAVVWNASRVGAADHRDRAISFGVISLGAGQTARLNTVYVGNPDGSQPGDQRRARRVTLAFDVYGVGNPDGMPGLETSAAASCLNRQRFIRRESCEVTLIPGESASFDFVAPPEGARIGAIMLGGPDTSEGSDRRAPDPHVVPALEVMEGGRTVFTHPAVSKGMIIDGG